MKKTIFCFVLAMLILPAQAKVGYLLTVNSVNDFPAENYGGVNQQPERNAASWFETEYINKGKGDFITLSQMKSGIDVNTYSVLWVNVDRVGLASLAATGIDNSVVSAIKNYAAAGGKLYLTKQACMLAYSMGRIGYEPWFNNGGYTNGTDVWSINAMVGFGYTLYDHRSHAIYTGVTEEDAIDHYVYPMIGAVARTDNNNLWGDLMRREGAGETHYENSDPQRLLDFEGDWNCTVLGVWGHVADYCAAGLVEFNAQSGYATIIANGLAAYQWGTSNNYIVNVKKLTANILSYLQGETPTPTPTPVGDVTKVKLTMDILTGKRVKETVTNTYVPIQSAHTPVNIDGSKGQALRTDGWSTYLEMPISNKGLSDQTLTVALTCAVQTYPMMVLDYAENKWSYIAGNLSGNTGFAFCLSSQGDFRFECYAGGWKVNTPGSTVIKLPVNQWNHLVATMDIPNKKVFLYNNGVKIGESNIATSATSLNIGTNPMFIGKSNERVEADGFLLNTFNGLIDDIQIDNKVWSAAEAAEYANNNAKAPNFNLPVTYWENDLYRPSFHGMPSMNWTNETHGMTYSNGKYHVFFQKNGNGPYMSRLHWGHISSENLLDWQEEFIALYPLSSYDIKGCWSGAVFTDNAITGGKPWIVYTGVDNGHASMNFASPDDDAFIKWTKALNNPRIGGVPGGYDSDFRDPYFFRNGNDAYIIVGCGKGGVGTTVLYKYNNGNWNHVGEFFTGSNSNTCGNFFEMPNITPMGDGKWIFTATPLGTSNGVRTLYWVGTISSDGRFQPYSNVPKTVDLEGCAKHGYGLLSPTVYTKDGRTVAMGIVPDKLPTGDNRDMGWAHTYSLPREWSLDASNNLVQKPVREVEQKRSETNKYSRYNFTLNGRQELGSVKGRRLEVSATFKVASSEFGMRLLKSEFGSLKISFNPNSQELVVDMSGISRKVNDGGVFNGRYATSLPAVVRSGENFKLNVFLDHSILDIFINDKWATSIRVFSTDQTNKDAEIYASGNTEVVSVEAWEIKPDPLAVDEVVFEDVEEVVPFGYNNGAIVYNLDSEMSVVVYDSVGRPLLNSKGLQGRGSIPFDYNGMFIVLTDAGKTYKLMAY